MGLGSAALNYLGGAAINTAVNVAGNALNTWLQNKINASSGVQMGQESHNQSVQNGSGWSKGGGQSSSTSDSQSQYGTDNAQTQKWLEQLMNYNSSSMANQTKNNRKNMLMAMGYNTLGAIQQGIYNHIEQQAAMNYNSAEAAKNRDWQEMMSNTSYQRAVADMKKAGINPILAFGSGASGASTPSGAQGTISSASMGMAGTSALSNTALGGATATANYGWSKSHSESASTYYNIAENIMSALTTGGSSPKVVKFGAELAEQAAEKAAGEAFKAGGGKSGGTGGGRK